MFSRPSAIERPCSVLYAVVAPGLHLSNRDYALRTSAEREADASDPESPVPSAGLTGILDGVILRSGRLRDPGQSMGPPDRRPERALRSPVQLIFQSGAGQKWRRQ